MVEQSLHALYPAEGHGQVQGSPSTRVQRLNIMLKYKIMGCRQVHRCGTKIWPYFLAVWTLPLSPLAVCWVLYCRRSKWASAVATVSECLLRSYSNFWRSWCSNWSTPNAHYLEIWISVSTVSFRVHLCLGQDAYHRGENRWDWGWSESEISLSHSKIASNACCPLQMARTQKNKATQAHLGVLKARLAKLRRELIQPKGGGGGGGEGFDVAKTGDARVGFVGEQN